RQGTADDSVSTLGGPSPGGPAVTAPLFCFEDPLTHTLGIDALGAVLRKMNPYPLGNPTGICETCAIETLHVLRQGRDPQPVIRVLPPDREALAAFRDLQQQQWQKAMGKLKGDQPPPPKPT